ncbi:MAG: delta-60 repeat domain-containing protein [Flavobacteriales bacterium]|nr:delta-60 repeat domain-containing protein [Flavobacteriales bacterium]
MYADGTRDQTFDTGTGPDAFVSSVVLQPDGKIIVAGAFYNYNGTSVPRIIRLNTDGSPDQQFAISLPTNYYAAAVLLQPDGKVIAGGGYTDLNEGQHALDHPVRNQRRYGPDVQR